MKNSVITVEESRQSDGRGAAGDLLPIDSEQDRATQQMRRERRRHAAKLGRVKLTKRPITRKARED